MLAIGTARHLLGTLLLLAACRADPPGTASVVATATPLHTPPTMAPPLALATLPTPATPGTTEPARTAWTSVATRTPLPTAQPTPATVAAPVTAPAPAAPALPPAYAPLTAPSAPAVEARPRAFRTPEREVPRAFVPPQTGADTDAATDASGAPQAPPAAALPGRSSVAMVVFRATARTGLEGFDIRVAYPREAGTFAPNGQPVDCNAGTGALVAANDRGSGELRLLVASAQALPFPLDVFCRFTRVGGAGLDGSSFAVRVAEVTSDGKRADPGLLLVDVVVR